MLQKAFKTWPSLSTTGKGEDLMQYCSNEWWQPLTGQELFIGRYESHLPDSADVRTQASQDGPVTEFNLFINVDPDIIFFIKCKEPIRIRCMWISAWDIIRRRAKAVHTKKKHTPTRQQQQQQETLLWDYRLIESQSLGILLNNTTTSQISESVLGDKSEFHWCYVHRTDGSELIPNTWLKVKSVCLLMQYRRR
jgi:hypothetical protein